MFFGPLPQNHPSFPAHNLLSFMDSAVNEALRALNTANLRRYTELQCPNARRRRLKAAQRLVRLLLGDPNIVWGTNTKGNFLLNWWVLQSPVYPTWWQSYMHNSGA